jgi:oxygen-independent coproporphyrinogen III oxidase
LAGIYIHIPFCKQACNYCNFHFSVSLKHKAAFTAALLKEIISPTQFITDNTIETIYFGGGTPSLLTKADLEAIFEVLHSRFDIVKDAEITLEANPDDITIDILKTWKKIGINRLSVGLQSFNEAELKWMNRAHNAAQSLKCLDDIQTIGFSNFSVDLIYGSPLQTDEDLKRNFQMIASKNIPHISCYALTVENGTLLNKQIREKKSPDVDNEKQAEQFHLLLKLMENAGYEQYEISNFCKPGYRSKHNSSYWQGKPYFGFGPSAHSFDGKKNRRWNIANNSLYIQSLAKKLIPYETETLTDEESVNEYVMTALRTMEGINLEVVVEKFGIKNKERVLFEAEKYLKQGKLKEEFRCLKLTNEGKFFADGIAADLFC